MKLSRKEHAQLKLIGRNIRKLRRARGLTRAELAHLTNITQIALMLYEEGMILMRVEELLRLAKVLEVAPDKLYTRWQ